MTFRITAPRTITCEGETFTTNERIARGDTLAELLYSFRQAQAINEARVKRGYGKPHDIENAQVETLNEDSEITATRPLAELSEDELATPAFQVGDGVCWGEGTDATAGTVVKVTPKAIHVVEDEAKLLNGTESGEPDALHFQRGGFIGHTSGDQRYEFSPGNGPVIRFTLRARTQRFKMAGTSINGSMASWGNLSHGRYKHYDYNF